MELSVKILLFIVGATLFGVIISPFIAPPGGAYADYAAYFIIIGSISLFLASLFFIIIHRLHSDSLVSFIFPVFMLLLSLPFTIRKMVIRYNQYQFNRPPDLTPRYERPVDSERFLKDSIRVLNHIEKNVQRQNDRSGGPYILDVKIDTIIYSERGDKIFIAYAEFFEPNDWGNDVDVAYLIGESKEYGNWNLKTPVVNIGGSYSSFEELKTQVRKILFHNFVFGEENQKSKKYFWRSIMNR